MKISHHALGRFAMVVVVATGAHILLKRTGFLEPANALPWYTYLTLVITALFSGSLLRDLRRGPGEQFGTNLGGTVIAFLFFLCLIYLVKEHMV